MSKTKETSFEELIHTYYPEEFMRIVQNTKVLNKYYRRIEKVDQY